MALGIRYIQQRNIFARFKADRPPLKYLMFYYLPIQCCLLRCCPLLAMRLPSCHLYMGHSIPRPVIFSSSGYNVWTSVYTIFTIKRQLTSRNITSTFYLNNYISSY